jgi:hypothetical protein
MSEQSSDWQSRLRLLLEDFVDEFVVAGIDHREVLDAVVNEAAALRGSLENDPDPAEDSDPAVDEPANDWPAAG